MRLFADFIVGSVMSLSCRTSMFSQLDREPFPFRNGPHLKFCLEDQITKGSFRRADFFRLRTHMLQAFPFRLLEHMLMMALRTA